MILSMMRMLRVRLSQRAAYPVPKISNVNQTHGHQAVDADEQHAHQQGRGACGMNCGRGVIEDADPGIQQVGPVPVSQPRAAGQTSHF